MRRSRALWSGAFISETVWRHNRAEFWGKAEPSPVLPKQALPGTQTRGGAGPIDFTSPQKGHAFDLYTPLMRAPGCQWWQFGWDTHTPTGFGTLQGDQRSRGARGREKTLYNIMHSQRNLTVLNRASLVSWADTGKHTKKKSHLIQTWRNANAFIACSGQLDIPLVQGASLVNVRVRHQTALGAQREADAWNWEQKSKN